MFDFKKLFLPVFLKNKMISEFKENSLFDEENGINLRPLKIRSFFDIIEYINKYYRKKKFENEKKENNRTIY